MRSNRRTLAWAISLLFLGFGLLFVFQRFVLERDRSWFRWMREDSTIELMTPEALGVLLLAPVLLFALGRSLADLPWQQRALSFLFRVTFLGLLGLALSTPVRSYSTTEIATAIVVDVSDSISDEALGDARREAESVIRGRRASDQVRLITFAARPRLVQLEHQETLKIPSIEELRHTKERGRTSSLPGVFDPSSEESPSARTDIQAALQLAYGVLPPGALKRAILITDGLETDGDLLAEANRARGFGVRLFAIPLRRPPPGEVSVLGLNLPDKVDVGQTFSVRAEIYASRPTTARVRLFQGEALNGLGGVRDLSLAQGRNQVAFESIVRIGGEVTYALELEPRGPDKFKENNTYRATLEVPGRPLVLYVEGQLDRARYLANALTAQQFEVDVRSPAAFPVTLGELERFDFAIVSDVPRESLGLGMDGLVERYVRDLGGGFLFAGGASGFGLGGWAHSGIERLLPVRMDAERRKEMPGVAMALVIDRSGSMTGLPMEMAKSACSATLTTLQGDDLIEVIAFDADPARAVKLQPVRYRARIQNDIQRIAPGGGTEIFPALDLAYRDLSVVQARKKHVILLTDGQAAAQGIPELTQAMLSDGITVTTVGLGDGVNAELLGQIADAGGGRFHHAPDPNSLPKIFTRETELVSQQAAVDDWFPVAQVAPADFLRGISIAGAPLLHGYVSTELKPAPAQMVLQSDRGEPILARWRAGLGWALAWTSDVKNGWAVEWLGWPAFGKFWGQLVREHMRVKRRREVEMQTRVDGSRVRATVDAFTADERFDNSWSSRLLVRQAGAKHSPREIAMRQVAPGRYEADFELDRYGTFLLRAQHSRRTEHGTLEPAGVSFAHVSNPYPREYASFEPDVDRLRGAVLAGGGSLDPSAEQIFDPAGEKIVRHSQLYRRFVLVALLLFILDLLVRRVRLFDRKVGAKRI